MFCEKCGGKIGENAKFCKECGAKVVGIQGNTIPVDRESIKSDEGEILNGESSVSECKETDFNTVVRQDNVKNSGYDFIDCMVILGAVLSVISCFIPYVRVYSSGWLNLSGSVSLWDGMQNGAWGGWLIMMLAILVSIFTLIRGWIPAIFFSCIEFILAGLILVSMLCNENMELEAGSIMLLIAAVMMIIAAFAKKLKMSK